MSTKASAMLARYQVSGPAPFPGYETIVDQITGKSLMGRHLSKLERIEKSLSYWCNTHHPGFVPVLRYLDKGSKVLVLLEYPVGGKTLSKINASKEKPETIQKMFIDVLSAFHFLADNGVFQPNLDLQNIVFSREKGTRLIGFEGFSLIEPSGETETQPLDVRYVCPERLVGDTLSEKSLVYTVGSLFYHFLVGKLHQANEPFSKVTRIRRKFKAEWDDLLAVMLQPRPENRPDFQEIWTIVPKLLVGQTKTDLQQFAWLGKTDTAALEFLRNKLFESNETPIAVSLEVYPGRERIPRLKPFAREAETAGYLVLHTWVKQQEEVPFKIINDLLYLLREGIFKALDHGLERELVPLSEWERAANLKTKWRSLIERMLTILIPNHYRGVLFIVEDCHHVDQPSLEALRDLAKMLGKSGFMIILSSHAFSNTALREFQEKWPYRWEPFHPKLFRENELKEVLWTNTNTDSFLADCDTMLTRNQKESAFFYWLEGRCYQNDAYNEYLAQCRRYLQSKEQLVLKLLSCSLRRLSSEDLSAALEIKNVACYADELVRLGYIEKEGDCFKPCFKDLVEFTKTLMPAHERTFLQERLLAYEQTLETPDMVQIVYLKICLQQTLDIEKTIRQITAQIHRTWDINLLLRLEEAYKVSGSKRLKGFHLFAELLRGKQLRLDIIPVGSPNFRGIAKGVHFKVVGQTKRAFENYYAICIKRYVGAGLKLHALVMAAECASELGDDTMVARLWRSFLRVNKTKILKAHIQDVVVRFVVLVNEINKRIPTITEFAHQLDEDHHAWIDGHKAWRSGDFEFALVCFRKALELIKYHYDLNLVALAYKCYGNALYRNNRAEEAILAYREAERCYQITENEKGLDNVNFNYASVLKLAGDFKASRLRFESIHAKAEENKDATLACHTLYSLMAIAVFQNEMDKMIHYNRRQRDLCAKLVEVHERLKAVILRLHCAFALPKVEVIEDLKTLHSLKERTESYPLLLEEIEIADKIGRYAAGQTIEAPSEEYPRFTEWRHRLIDFLVGSRVVSFETLIQNMGKGFFQALHFTLLKTLIAAESIPKEYLSESLAESFENYSRQSGAHYSAFVRRFFPRYRKLGGIPREEWEQAHKLFLSLSWSDRDLPGLTRRILRSLNRVWQVSSWGLFSSDGEDWYPSPLNDGDVDHPGVRETLKTIHTGLLEGPLITNLAWSDSADEFGVLFLPLQLGGTEDLTVAWFLGERNERGDIGSHYDPLFRFYTKLLEYVFQQRRERAGQNPVLPSTKPGVRGFGIVGRSRLIQNVVSKIEKFGASELNIYISGESGTGKELVARAIHNASPRAREAFRALNCSHFPDNLVESELFGHARGSFTGANTERVGLLEVVDGGTLFLDEIGDINPRIQSLLLRVIQEGEFSRVGESQIRKIDIRFVTATNKNLRGMIDNGSFRGDLFFRIVEEELMLPPLRHRLEDLPLLVQHFARMYSPERNVTFTSPFLEKLRAYFWPGNVRELESYIRKVLVEWPSVSLFTDRECMPFLFEGSIPSFQESTLQEFEEAQRKRFIQERLRNYGGNRSSAAKSLGISRQQLSYLSKKYEADPL